MNAQQLKNAILQEAIEGRLVPQDPNDEPASALLARIRKEKEQLVKKGKLKKKDLEVKPISEDEIPFEIPDSWEWVRLKSLVSVLGDGIHGTPEYDITGGYYFINGNNLSNNKIVIKADTKKVNEKEYQTYKKELNDKTILVSINGTIGNVGHYNGEPVILGKSACYYNLLDINLKPYITMLMYTDYFLKYAVENATGSTIKNVSLAVMNEFLIPFPPVAEQHRIVSKIEELLPKVEEYGKAQDALNNLNAELPERLKKSILQEAIEGRLVPQDPNDEPASVLLAQIRKEKEQLVKEGKLKKKDLIETPITDDEIPFDAPKGWEWSRLSGIALDSADGPFGSNLKSEHYTTRKEVRIIQLSNIGEFGWKDNNSKYTTYEHLQTISRSEAFPGDVIIAKMMPAGRAIICPSDDPKYVLSSDAVRFDFDKRLNRKFLYYAINSPVFINQVYSEVQGITRVRTSLSKLRFYLLPIPPIAEQNRIVEKLERLLGEIDKLKK